MTPWKCKEVIGDCTLYLGDCLDVLPHVGPVDAVVTDPPYGISQLGGKWGRKNDLKWDKSAPDVSMLLALGEHQIIWGGNYFALPPSRGWLVWHKRDSVPSAADVELAWTSIDMNSRLVDQTISATNAERCGHPTQKPLKVMVWTLGFIPTARVVLDPFMGSGTTGVACVKGGRSFVGIERDGGYFAMACERIRKAYAQPDMFVSAPAPQPEQLSILDGAA